MKSAKSKSWEVVAERGRCRIVAERADGIYETVAVVINEAEARMIIAVPRVYEALRLFIKAFEQIEEGKMQEAYDAAKALFSVEQ